MRPLFMVLCNTQPSAYDFEHLSLQFRLIHSHYNSSWPMLFRFPKGGVGPETNPTRALELCPLSVGPVVVLRVGPGLFPGVSPGALCGDGVVPG